MVTYRRKAYTRSDGTKIKSTMVHAKGSGKSRGRKTGGRYKSPTSKSWITKEGKLGGSGFLSKSSSTQHKLLDKCVRKYGYRSCLGSIMVLLRNKTIKAKHGKKLRALKDYLKKNYGGEGSFARKKSRKAPRKKRSRSKSRKTNRSRR